MNDIERRQKLIEEDQKVMLRYRRKASGIALEPKNMTFSSQNPNEKIFVYLRRHWIENISWIFRNFTYSFIPFVLYFLLEFLGIDLSVLSEQIQLVILLAFYSVIITNIFRDFFDWFFDIYIITNERIVNYHFKPFSNYKVKEAMLQSIDSIKETSGGVVSNLFGYGDLIMTIDGPNDQFTFQRIPNASTVRDIIADLAKIAKKYYGVSR